MNSPKDWHLYGAYGYTGRMIAAEAVRRGHNPILGGRSRAKLEPLAKELGLRWRAFSLDDHPHIVDNLRGCSLVLHAAGPFVHTSDRMIRACLEAGVHYVDITGEITVFENTFGYHSSALQKGVLLMSGAGIDVIPSDCLIKAVHDKLPAATLIESAAAAVGQPSSGTVKSGIGIIAAGGLVRRNGKLVRARLARGIRRIRFSDHPRTVIPFPWGDLSTAYRSTGVGDINTYVAVPHQIARLLQFIGSALPPLLRPRTVQKVLGSIIDGFYQPGEDAARIERRSHFWARAAAPDGREVQGTLETLEAYVYTAAATVRAIERILAENPSGALSPAQALGSDFIYEISGTSIQVGE